MYNKKYFIGAHINKINGLVDVITYANKLKFSAFSFFINNPVQWENKIITDKVIYNFRILCDKYHYSDKQILPHSSYLINLGHPIDANIKKSRISFINEINKCEQLGLRMINTHPGSHLNKITENTCLKRISDSINIALDKTKGVTIVIENTAGQGSNVGFKFEHLSKIIDKVYDKTRIGVCIDICHAFAAGYDFRTIENCENTFKMFNNIIGFSYLRGMHLNDSKYNFNSKIDRHQNINKGKIGKTIFVWMMKDNRFKGIPMILETINSTLWIKEISWLKSLSVDN